MTKTLSCDDECLKLQRNQKLAAALNINPETHQDDHIPYSQETLDMFKGQTKWCQTQEREFRVFATDDAEKRLRFKPMTANQRAFLHALAEDFGLDSESMDPEPHRHVAIFKTPRFVSAPLKTLGQCVRIRAVAETASVPKKPAVDANPWNAFVLASPRFALTIDELRSEIQADLSRLSTLIFDISFLPSEEIVIKAQSNDIPDQVIESNLTGLKPALVRTVKAQELASEVALCHVDSSLNILRRESDQPLSGGWSQVAKGASANRKAPAGKAIGASSTFTVLGTKQPAKKVKEVKEDVADNWESAVDSWD